MSDPTIKSLQGGLAKGKGYVQCYDLTAALGMVQTPAGTRALVPLLTDRNDVIRGQAIQSMIDRLKVKAETVAGDEALLALVKIAPSESVALSRSYICWAM